MKVDLFTMGFNEEPIVQFMIDHYRERFKDIHINFFDNESTDRTKEIALKNGCTVIDYFTNNQVDDQKLTNHKNSCWKNSNADWIIVCDVDEMLDCNEEQLKMEQDLGTSIIRSEGFNMVCMDETFNLAGIKHGAKCPPYDKKVLFKKSDIEEIGYTPGAHQIYPVGRAQYSKDVYKLYHYNFINLEWNVARHEITKTRMGDYNKKMGWGKQYTETSAQTKRAAMEHSRTYAIIVRD